MMNNLEKTVRANLPAGSVVWWCHLNEDSEHHMHDEDMVYISLLNGVKVDAGQYGMASFFRVDMMKR